jgi:flagellar biosynthetic protein FliP
MQTLYKNIVTPILSVHKYSLCTLLLLALILLSFTQQAYAADAGIPALSVTTQPNGEQTYTLSLQIMALMTVISILPAALIMMTSFTRIIIVLAILRQALGLAQTPSNQILMGLALFLSFFIMSPVFEQVNNNSVQPYLSENISASEAIDNAGKPFKEFMLGQTRETDLDLFARISEIDGIESTEDIPFRLLMPAFVTSELKTAFQIGFLIFIPFIIIDLVIASVLMAMGMMMLSPLIISLPFKIMLFVLIDGWSLIMGALASSFYFQS